MTKGEARLRIYTQLRDMAKKYRLSSDEQSQLHGIMPCFTFVVVEFVFIEEKFQAFMAYIHRSSI